MGDTEHKIKREGEKNPPIYKRVSLLSTGMEVKGLDLVRPWSLHANREQHPELISDLFPSASVETVMEIWLYPQQPETFK